MNKKEQIEFAYKAGNNCQSWQIAPAQCSWTMSLLKGRKVGETPEGEASTKEICGAWELGRKDKDFGMSVKTTVEALSIIVTYGLEDNPEKIFVTGPDIEEGEVVVAFDLKKTVAILSSERSVDLINRELYIKTEE